MTRFHLDFTRSQGAFTIEVGLDVTARALALSGPSGSGKTSILESIAGVRQPRDGRITVGDRVLFDAAAGIDVPLRDRRVGYVPQDALLFPHMSVRENVYFARRGPVPDAMMPVLDQLELTALFDRGIASLSGGERQRVALARALCSNPGVLLLDEPVSAIDLRRRRRILDALAAVRDEIGIPIVYVTHAPDEARAIADYAVTLDEGRVVEQGRT